MSPARIRRRRNKTGFSYQVVYRRGGRAFNTETAGTFQRRKEAEIRRDLVGGWLAQGLDPKLELARLLAQPLPGRKLGESFDAMSASRHDVSSTRLYQYGRARALAIAFFGADRDPATITVPEVREYVGNLADRFAASTVESYFRPLAQVLDFLELPENPARHRTVKLPAIHREEPIIMTLRQFRAMLSRLSPPRWVLFVRILEATGLRVGELASLLWGDVDAYESRLRISIARTKTRAGQRWAQLPKPLMDELDVLLPREDRTPERRVFPYATNSGARNAMLRACRLAGVRAFTPHDLRHRRASLWHAQGVPDRQVQERIGHERLSTTQDVYTHVVVDPTDDEWT